MNYYLLIASVLFFIAVISSKVAGRLGVPSLLVFILIGILAGSDGIVGIYFDNYLVAQTIGVIALAYILFAGGISIEMKEIKPVLYTGLGLSTVGIVITAIIVGLFAYYFLEFSLIEGILLGSIISSTDAAAVFAILRSKNVSLKGNLKPLLEFESGSNDPMAVFLTVGIISLIITNSSGFLPLIPNFLQQMLIGGLSGYLIGIVMIKLINRIKLEYDGLYSVLTISAVLFIYGISTQIGGNGFLAVYVTGLVMANKKFIHKKSLIRFHDGIAWLMQILMFLTLGLLVFVKDLSNVFWPGILTAIVLIFIARPLAVFLTLAFSKFKLKEKILISWVGLRGAAPIVLATFPLLANIPESHTIFNIVFFVVIISVLLQGTSISFLARLLALDEPVKNKPKSPIEFEPAESIKSELLEFEISEYSPVIGKQLLDLNLPEGSLIVLILRDSEFLVPGGNTIIEKYDRLLILASKDSDVKIQSFFE